MGKQPKIRWLERDNKQLAKDVRYYNNKRSKAIKDGTLTPENAPPKMSIKDIKAHVNTRLELKSIYKTLNFMRRKDALEIQKSKYGLKVTNVEMFDVKNKLKKINANRRMERKLLENLPLKSRGKATGQLVKERMDNALKELAPKKFNFNNKKKQDWQSFVESVEKQSANYYSSEKMKLFKANYIKSIQTIFGEPIATELTGLMEGVGVEEFMKNYLQDTEGNIDFNYDDNADLSVRYLAIKQMWTAKKITKALNKK